MKKTILLTTRVYSPGHLAGGPVRSIVGIVDKLSDQFDWKVLTTDRDLDSDVPYATIQSDCWTDVGNAQVWYASRRRGGALALLEVLRKTPHDLLYLNSFFDPLFSILPVVATKAGLLGSKPVLVAPRGEHSRGALGLKAAKKLAYLRVAKILGLYERIAWHASGTEEARDIAAAMALGDVDNSPISIASDIPARITSAPKTLRARGAPLRVCFLGRVARMKNLDFALRALARVDRPVAFSIIGPLEDEAYWQECGPLLNGLPKHVNSSYRGAVAADEVGNVLASQDLLFVPSRGENFGHVFIEALAAGVPVLTSDRTPWRNLEALGVGWDLPLGEKQLDAFARHIDQMADLDDFAQSEMSVRAIEMGTRIRNDQNIVDMNRRMFSSLLD